MTGLQAGPPETVVLVIPAYNEARAIGDVVARSLAVARHVIVVDDGSTDATWSELARHPVCALRHASNRGKAAALLTGIARALRDGAERIVTLDGDGQHRPEDVARLVQAADHAPGAIITGSRRADGWRAPRARDWANRTADFFISWAAGGPIEDTQSGLRLYPAAVLRRLLAGAGRSRGFAFESEILIAAGRAGIVILPVPIPALYGGPTARASHFRPLRDIPRIAVVVAWQLLRRGLSPVGLWRVVTHRGSLGVADEGLRKPQKQSSWPASAIDPR
jgi:glycosyltransferase involved in cell wall biosynthesis